MKVLVTSAAFGQPAMQENIKYLNSVAETVVMKPSQKPLTAKEIATCWDGVDGIIAGMEPYTKEILAQAPENLKVISRYGVGYDRIDTEAAKEKGISVCITPGANSKAVAELTMAMMLALSRGIVNHDKNVKEGKWIRPIGFGLEGRTLGILGFGAIGREVSLMAKVMGMTVIAYDPFFNEAFAKENGILKGTLDEVYEKSDFITLHMPVTTDTKYMINKESIARMKDGVYLVNCARGELVECGAVYEAVKNGKIAGFGVDAYEQEPPVITDLYKHPNVIATPHVGGHSVKAAERMGRMAIDNMLEVLEKGECRFCVNK